jgi:hypothetical protein
MTEKDIPEEENNNLENNNDSNSKENNHTNPEFTPPEESRDENKKPETEDSSNPSDSQNIPPAGEPAKPARDSNFQISLVKNNLLKVKVLTGNGVRIDCFAKDKNSESKSQSNSIYIHSKESGKSQEIEVSIEIDSEGQLSITGSAAEKKNLDETPQTGTEDQSQKPVVLIPNPDVQDLIENKYAIPKTPEEELQEKISKGNPFIKFREFYQRNLTIGIIIAIILHLFAVTVYFANAKKKGDVSTDPVQKRIIVIQDLPEPQINLEEVEDPNAPPEEVEEEEKEIPRITPRNITRPPRVNRPVITTEPEKTDTTDIARQNRELDSLRKLASGDTTAAGDTTQGISSDYTIPDSLRRSFSENEVGLNLHFPQNWRLIDSREIDQNKKEFLGIILADTTAEEQGTMNLFINLDQQGSEFRRDQFTGEFTMEDTTLTAFYREPFVEGAFMKYYFYIFNDIGTEKLSVRADIRKQFFEDYKKNIEAVVRSISIRKPTSLN